MTMKKNGYKRLLPLFLVSFLFLSACGGAGKSSSYNSGYNAPAGAAGDYATRTVRQTVQKMVQQIAQQTRTTRAALPTPQKRALKKSFTPALRTCRPWNMTRV